MSHLSRQTPPGQASQEAVRALHSLAALRHTEGKDDIAGRLHQRATNMELASVHYLRDPEGTAAARGYEDPGINEGVEGFARLADTYAARGDFEEAIRLQHRVIDAIKEKHGEESPTMVPALTSLAAMLEGSGQTFQANAMRSKIAFLTKMSAH